MSAVAHAPRIAARIAARIDLIAQLWRAEDQNRDADAHRIRCQLGGTWIHPTDIRTGVTA